MKETQDNNAVSSAEQTISNAPALAANRDSALLFFSRYMGWNAIKSDARRIYARYYSEKEIDELLRFYSSTAGKKSLTAGYEIPAEINKIATANLQAHVSELNRLLPAKTNNEK
ncbi:MAG: DUF2059 domain-containing protein [Chitinophagaceae bacterium]|nr:DUF2059 domain-containing protein [Chitinophagaceae bacterium]